LNNTDHIFPHHFYAAGDNPPAILLVENAKARMQVKIDVFERAFTIRNPKNPVHSS
jgi:hypothetical protein